MNSQNKYFISIQRMENNERMLGEAARNKRKIE